MANSALNFLVGAPGRIEQAQRFTPQQQQALNQLLSQGLSNSNPDALESRARRQFQTQTIPSIAERFTSGLGPGTRASGQFTGALGQAGSDLESQLAALRSQYGLQQLQFGLQPQFENLYAPGTSGVGQGLAGGIGQGLGYAAPSFLKSLLGGIGGGNVTEEVANQLGGAGGQAASRGLGSVASGIGSDLAPSVASSGVQALSGLGSGGAGGLAAAAGGFLPLAALLAALGVGYGAYRYLDSQD